MQPCPDCAVLKLRVDIMAEQLSEVLEYKQHIEKLNDERMNESLKRKAEKEVEKEVEKKEKKDKKKAEMDDIFLRLGAVEEQVVEWGGDLS